MLRRNRKKGFTLVELLVVIAIIAILAGLLLPALENARMTAIGMQCMTRMKNWGTAFNFYGGDYNQVYPCPWWSYIEDASGNKIQQNDYDYKGWWMRKQVGAYIDAVAQYKGTKLGDLAAMGVGCPSVPQITYNEALGNYPGYGETVKSMVENPPGHGAGSSQYYMDSIGCNFPDKVKSPSSKVLLGETGHPYLISYWGAYMKGGYRHYDTIDAFMDIPWHTNFPNVVHNEGANYLFFDGHTAWYPGFPENATDLEMTKMIDVYHELYWLY